MRTLRWSEQDLKKHLTKNAPRRAPDRPVATLARITTPRSRSFLAIESLQAAHLSGTFSPQSFLELTFEGARLLSGNELFALSHYQRIAYRKAWHQAISDAVLAATKQFHHIPLFTCFSITAYRRAPKALDLDSLSGCFKYAIDGLRYARLITDDSPTHLVALQSTQEIGPHMIRLRIEVVDTKEVSQTVTVTSCMLTSIQTKLHTSKSEKRLGTVLTDHSQRKDAGE